MPAHRRNRALRHRLGGALLAATTLLIAACTEVEVGAQAYKTFANANDPQVTWPAETAAGQPSGGSPSLHPDRAAFHAIGVAVWDGEATLPGVWVTHPMVTTARRVRLTNNLTGAQADAALFPRDAGGTGPSITVSSEAALRLGMYSGQPTTVAIEALTYGTATPAPGAASLPQAPAESAQAQATESDALEVAPLAAVASPAPADGAAPVSPPEPEPARQAAPQAAPSPAAEPATAPAAESTTGSTTEPAAGQAGDGSLGAITDGRRFIPAGVFGEPANAARLATTLAAADLSVTERPVTRGSRTFTRVLVGPFDTIAERDAALRTVRALGPADVIPARG